MLNLVETCENGIAYKEGSSGGWNLDKTANNRRGVRRNGESLALGASLCKCTDHKRLLSARGRLIPEATGATHTQPRLHQNFYKRAVLILIPLNASAHHANSSSA